MSIKRTWSARLWSLGVGGPYDAYKVKIGLEIMDGPETGRIVEAVLTADEARQKAADLLAAANRADELNGLARQQSSQTSWSSSELLKAKANGMKIVAKGSAGYGKDAEVEYDPRVSGRNDWHVIGLDDYDRIPAKDCVPVPYGPGGDR